MPDSSRLSSAADLLHRWLPVGSSSLLLNTREPDVAAAVQARQAEPAPLHCHFAAEASAVHDQLGLPALTFPQVPAQPPERVIWAWPKAKAEADMLLAWLAAWLPASGELWLSGDNRAGIRSAPRFLTQRGWTVRKVGSARHAALLRAQPPTEAHSFSLDTYWQTVSVPEAENRLLCSLPGVFSHGRIDRGSQYLLPLLADLQGPVLDFGCGAGLLSLVVQALHPEAAITAVDNHWLAILSSRETARRNGWQWDLHWQDGLGDLQGPFATLVTNPPFHTGLDVQYDTTHDLIARSRHLLQPGGRWLAVVNDHLPYRDWLLQHLGAVECLRHEGGFRVWSATV
ncbi:class I SAM-dependent methyltransferase [Natronospirillum operosum]|nr:class I SAM-dependent methyltransferase [Natronospirillum operosum]